jgi:aminopeptidase N
LEKTIPEWDSHPHFETLFYPQNSVQLDAKGFDIKSVLLYDSPSKKFSALKYEYDTKVVNIQLDKTYNRNENYIIQIS